MDQVITYKPHNSDIPRVWDYGTNTRRARARNAADDLATIRRWDAMGLSYVNSYLFDPGRLATFQAMTLDEYDALERNHYLTQPCSEITEDDYWYALEVLPPKHYSNGAFLMIEHLTGPYTSMYKQIGSKYYTKIVDASDRSTWNWLPE